MARSPFLPTPRQGVCLAFIGLSALGCGFYLRYQVIEQTHIGIACGDNPGTWLCAIRRVAIGLYNTSAIGVVALGAASLNLVRPHVVLCAIALFAAGVGIVLYNVGLSALAVALLVLSLARPAPETS
jgi:hypothetical protein